jgi:hypothetical protein
VKGIKAVKKLFIKIIIGLVVLLIAVVLVVFLSLNTIVKKSVETIGPQLTKVEIKLGRANISPLSGSGQLTKLFVGNPEGYKTPSAIQVGDIKVKVNIASVLSDTIKIESINIQSPEIAFEGGLRGSNIGKLLDNLNSGSGGGGEKPATEAAKPSGKSDKKFFVRDVVVEGGKIHLSATGLGGEELTVPLPPIHLQNIGSEKQGVTAAELARQILRPMLAGVTKAVADGVTDLGKGVGAVGQEAGKNVEKITGGLKGLFKK